LIGIAEKNPQVVKAPDQPPAANILEANSLDELKSEVRRQWAHNELRPNGPKKWVRKLKELGAPKHLDDKVTNGAQQLWAARNLIVHSRSIADTSYEKLYGIRKGEELKIGPDLLKTWHDDVVKLVEWADAFFIKYPKKT
jgi:hypothetical protein